MIKENDNEIKGIINNIFNAFKNNNQDEMEKYMHPNTTIWDVFTPQLIRGIKERKIFRAEDQEQKQSRGILTIKIDKPIFDFWNDTALARYYLNYSYEPPNPAEGEVRITDVFRKVKGKWLRMHHHEGETPKGFPPVN